VRARLPEGFARSLPQRCDRRVPGAVSRFLIIILLAALLPVLAFAAPTTYTGEAPVNSQADAERSEALKTALANVVIETTGDPGVLARSDVAAAVAKAERYVLQYRYRQNTAGTPDGARLVLVAEFDSTAVDQMLRRLGLGAFGDADTAEEAATPTEATVWIGGIDSADAYARVTAYLARNNLVRSAQPMQARADGMLVRLSLATDLRRFLDAVGMERILSVVNASPPVDGVDATLALGP
jgi:hypothetical protein